MHTVRCLSSIYGMIRLLPKYYSYIAEFSFGFNKVSFSLFTQSRIVIRANRVGRALPSTLTKRRRLVPYCAVQSTLDIENIIIGSLFVAFVHQDHPWDHHTHNHRTFDYSLSPRLTVPNWVQNGHPSSECLCLSVCLSICHAIKIALVRRRLITKRSKPYSEGRKKRVIAPFNVSYTFNKWNLFVVQKL